MNIQWYPGHMTKAKRMMEENIKLVDVVIELVDARVPISSQNPDVLKLAQNKPRIIVLNKVDLADGKETKKWADFFTGQGYVVVEVNSQNGKGIKSVSSAINLACKEKIERNKKRGLLNRPMRAMVVGIPNVGKSTFINKLVGKASAKTGNKPGVTKGKQWLKLKNEFELLDTPGVLWPKFEDQNVGIKLAMIGSIREEILDTEGLAMLALEFMRDRYPNLLMDKYPMTDVAGKKGHELLEAVTITRHLLKSGSEPDVSRMAKMFLDEFRNGKIGKMTLESVLEYKQDK
ncbi:MAG: ribosome biogenesis GTPase YlqF [Firmicutes bacterium HGW-Firmicutes-3]|nr:MAG: ribosome biogenesis GTPase YlqF [Firmicutes bacterium HGW-Firmicutes-3]